MGINASGFSVPVAWARLALITLLIAASSPAGYADLSGLSLGPEALGGVQTGTRCVAPPPDARPDFVTWPISGDASPDRVVAPYGPRQLNGNYDFHAGIDIPPTKPGGTIVRAAMDGRVVRKYQADDPAPGLCRFGNWIMLRHADSSEGVRRYTTYLHLQSFLVNLGDAVRAGDPIGIMGRTGCGVTTEHLHFEYYENLTNCGVLIARSRNPFGLPLPIRDQDNYRVQLGRLANQGSLMLRAEIPGTELDLVEYRVQSAEATFRVDLNEKIGVAPRPCTKCCDQALSPEDHIIQFRPQRFTGDGVFVLCISIDNANVDADYRVTLRDAKGHEVLFGPFSASDPPADISDCLASSAHGCSDVRTSACDVAQCREQE